MRHSWILCALFFPACLSGAELPGQYFRLLESGSAKVEAMLNATTGADLKTIEAMPG